MAFDSNVLRQPASGNPQSSPIKTVFAGLRIDKSYSLQRFQFDYTYTQTKFDNVPERDNHTNNYRGAWLWSLTPRITGTLDTAQVQTQVSGDETKNIRSNLRTTRTQGFTLDGAVSGGWHLLSGVSAIKQTSTAFTTTNPNFQQTGWSAGVGYESASGNSISAINYRRHGEYLNEIDFLNFFDNRYDENESELKVSWKASGNSVLTGRLAWRERHNATFPQRDFSRPVGTLDYNWQISGKLSLTASATQTIIPVREPFSSYRVDDTLTISPAWQVSEKVSLQLNLSHLTSDYRGPVRPPPGPLRRDVTQTASLTAVWAISTTNSVTAKLVRQQRNSNQPVFDFYDTLVSVSANLSF